MIPTAFARLSHTRTSPEFSPVWRGYYLDLSEALGDEASSIRRGKYTANMTTSERRAVGKLYPHRLAAANKAAQLMPQDSDAWSEVAVAATFDGDRSGAEAALWKAQALDPTNSNVYSWGLQMFQPKWGGNPRDLLKVAKLAAQNADPKTFPSEDFVEAVYHGGLKERKEELLTAALKRSPGDARLNYEVGAIYHYDKRQYKTAEQHYRVALVKDPTHSRCLSSLADLYFFVHNDAKGAENLYRKAIVASPNWSHNHANLARLLANTNRRAAAVVEAKKALALGEDRSHPVFAQLGM